MNKIIELRQADADSVVANGDYGLTLKYTNDFIVEEGDQLMVKNIFVDTLAQSNQKIALPQDVTLDMEHMYYYIYSRTDDIEEPLPGYGVERIDAEPWIVCYDVNKGTGTAANPTTRTMTNITIRGNYTSPVDAGTVQVTYKDIDGNTQVKKFNYPQSPSRQDPDSDVGVSLVYLASFPPQLKDLSNSGDGRPPIFQSISNDKDILLSAISNSTQITIEAGNYTPEQLVAEFNRLVQSAVKGSVKNDVYQNNLLVDVKSLQDEYPGGIYATNSNTGRVIKFRNGTIVVGASFIELAFIEAQNQFAFNFLHMPYYQDAVLANNQVVTPALVSVGYLPLPLVPPATVHDYVSINKNSGVIFDGLHSTYKDGSDARFWSNILGFDVGGGEGSLVDVPIRIDDVDATTGETIHSQKLAYQAEDGVNTTGGFMPLTAEVNLVKQDNKNWWESVRSIVTGANGLFSTSDDTYDILAGQKNTEQNQFRFGYYLISIDGDFRSQFYTKNTKENVMAIVSRFYESNSFTSGTSDDSIIYVHSGKPINLQRFHVKILKPDKSLAENLGNESAIYLELIKANQQPQ